MRPSHGLERTVESCPIPVVVLAERKEALEVVAGAIEAQRRKQPGRAPIAVEERMDVHQLELRNSAHDYGVDVATVQPRDHPA